MDISILLPYIENLMKKIKEDKLWEKLFIKKGESILTSEHDKETELFNQLDLLFSKDNLKKISKNLKNVNGFRFDDLLRNEMNKMFGDFKFEEKEREKYIDQYISLLTDSIRKKDPIFATALFLKEFRKENTHQHKEMREENSTQHKEILTGINELNKKFDKQKNETSINIKTISDVEKYLEENVNFDESQQKKVNLDFFDYEDDEFETRFYESFNQNCIYIKGETVEETIYYVLYLLRKKGMEDRVLIIYSKEEWDTNNANIKDKILIPFFYTTEKPVIPNNQIIYIFGKKEPDKKSPIILKKRLKKKFD